MKKKILSVILCVVMLASTLAVTVGAYTPIASLGSVSDKSCVKLTTGTAANHSTTIHFGSTITQDSTVTFYFKPEASTWSAQNGFPIILINADWAHTLAADALAAAKLATISCDIGPYYVDDVTGKASCGQGLFVKDNSGYAYNVASAYDEIKKPVKYMNYGEWNRIDMVVDFTNSTMTGYLNYESIGSMSLENAASGYKGIYIPYIKTATKTAYMDNLMVRSGCAVPSRGDVASNISLDTIKLATNIIHFNSFEDVPVSNHGEGGFWNNNTACYGLYTEDGIALQNGAVNRGYQQSIADGGKYNTRFVATLDDYTKYDEIGFKLTVNGKESYVPCGAVYDSVTGGFSITETYSALGSFGAGYIYCLTVTGMEEGTSYAVEVAPYTVAKGATKKTVGDSYTVTLTAGAAAQ